MNKKDLIEIQKGLAQTLQVVVNGKIDKLDTKLDSHILEHQDSKNDLVWIKRIMWGIMSGMGVLLVETLGKVI